MSWKSLSDVYSEQVIRDNNAATIESPLKEWRSLSDVYSGVMRDSYINEAKVEIIVNGATEEFELEDIYVQKICINTFCDLFFGHFHSQIKNILS